MREIPAALLVAGCLVGDNPAFRRGPEQAGDTEGLTVAGETSGRSSSTGDAASTASHDNEDDAGESPSAGTDSDPHAGTESSDAVGTEGPDEYADEECVFETIETFDDDTLRNRWNVWGNIPEEGRHVNDGDGSIVFALDDGADGIGGMTSRIRYDLRGGFIDVVVVQFPNPLVSAHHFWVLLADTENCQFHVNAREGRVIFDDSRDVESSARLRMYHDGEAWWLTIWEDGAWGEPLGPRSPSCDPANVSVTVQAGTVQSTLAPYPLSVEVSRVHVCSTSI